MAGKFIACFALIVSLHSSAFGCGLYYPLRVPGALEASLKEYDETKARLAAATSEEEATELKASLERIAAEVDYVAGQRHATVSRLFWYTDLDQAQAAAAESGKPILSLRMLGQLTDERSCANSRYFRTTLYANKEISDYLRTNYVLHWRSVRPVPQVTIDFGDGRKMECTITGNSAHYLLNAAGEPLDVLPGLYGPQPFLAWLKRGAQLVQEVNSITDPAERTARITKYHQDRLAQIRENWAADIRKVAPELLPGESPAGFDPDGHGLMLVEAREAANRAVTKSAAEIPVLQAIGESLQQTEHMVSDELWRRLAELHARDIFVDEQTVELMARQNPNAFDAGAASAPKAAAENPLLRLVANYQQLLALDTVRNEYLLHREIHNWFVRGEVNRGLDMLNERVYTDLFLTPSSDPWLGLAPDGVYSALDNGGLVLETR